MRAKIDQKSIKKRGQDREGLLDSILSGFGWIWGAKLGPSWEGKSSQDRPRQAKTKEDKGSEGKGKEEEGKGLEGKDVEKCAGGAMSAGGVVVHQTLRGTPPQDPRSWVARVVGDSCCDFFGNLVALLFCIVFRCLFVSVLALVSLQTWLPKSIEIK